MEHAKIKIEWKLQGFILKICRYKYVKLYKNYVNQTWKINKMNMQTMMEIKNFIAMLG